MRVRGCASDLTDEQWALPQPVDAPGMRGPEHAPDLRRVVDAMLSIARSGPVLDQVADGVRVRQREWVWSDATVVRGDGGPILVDPGIDGSDLGQRSSPGEPPTGGDEGTRQWRPLIGMTGPRASGRRDTR